MANAFRKTDLVAAVEKWTKWPKKNSRMAVDAVVKGIITGLTKNEKVQIAGFGAWTKKKIPARKGGKLVKNPFTGEMVKQKPKAAATKIKFRPAPVLKQL